MSNFFEKEMITDPSFDFIKNKLDDNFLIVDDEKSKVIFGYNGAGKTTLFKCIKKFTKSSDIEFLEYNDDRISFMNQASPVVVSAHVNEREQLKNTLKVLKSEINFKTIMKDQFGFTKQAEVQKFGRITFEAFKNNQLTKFNKSKEEIQSVLKLIEGISKKTFIKSIELLAVVANIQEERENYKKSILFKSLATLSLIVDDSDEICPICDSINNANLKGKISNKLEELNQIKSDIINNFNDDGISLTDEKFNELLKATELMRDNDLKQDFILCGGDTTLYDNIINNIDESQRIEVQLSQLQANAEILYSNLAVSETKIRQDLNRYFQISNDMIDFDNEKFEIRIKFNRDIKTYSTGEVNLLAFLLKVYSFIGSEKHTLIIDDPVSSLDLVNHYKIAFEIVKMADDKNIIILTHSVELLNVIHSQHPTQFDYYYIEEYNQSVKIEKITIGTTPNIITLHNLLDADQDGLIRGLILKENANYNDSIHKLFHYDINIYQHDGISITNHSLAAEIDGFSEIKYGNFLENSFAKIKLLVSLRIWIEKKMYELIPENMIEIQKNFLLKNTITDKINYLIPRNGEPLISLPNNLNRDILMSRKVMLNQSVHYQSQVMPFAYAISISLKDLTDEIRNIKETFNIQ